MPLVVPVAAGDPVEVSSEVGYEAFPFAVVDPNARTWVAYSNSATHVSAASDVRVRYADPGKTWSAASVVVTGGGGYGVGAGGLAVDPDGRLWLAVVRNKPTSGSTATEYTTSVRSLDAGTGLWSAATNLPAIAVGQTDGQTVGSGLLVRPDGTLLAAAYGTPAGATYSVGKVFAYDRTAGTWSTLSTVTLPSRLVQEPTLLTMQDGRLMMLFRSDAAPPYYCRLYAAISSDGGATWATPYQIAQHASGMPHGYVTPTGHIAVTYRGFSEPQNPPASYPPRILMLNPDGTSTGDGAIDVWGDITARYLYGRVVAGQGGAQDQWIAGLEGEGGQAGAGAGIYSIPLEWVERTG